MAFPVLAAVNELNLLFLLGTACLAGTFGAGVFRKLRIPQIVGYIIAGVLIGSVGFGLLSQEFVQSFVPFSIFALGIIGFKVGGALQLELFKKYGRQFITILFCEGVSAFLLVALVTTLAAHFFIEGWLVCISLGLALGGIASATDPASTVEVLSEYRTKGILTRTALAIVALDDGLALLLFSIASAVAFSFIGDGQLSLWEQVYQPMKEIFGAAAIGGITGLITVFVLKKIRDESTIFAFVITMILLLMGTSKILDVESILAAMVFGATVSNMLPTRSEKIFTALKNFSTPIYILFFVLVGASLKLESLSVMVFVLAGLYVLARSFGKMAGAWFGSSVSGASEKIRKYLGFCLFSQAGVAVGLSILITNRFPGVIGDVVVPVVAVTTLTLQVIGPVFVKVAARKSGEEGLNITEEDLMHTKKVKDVIDKSVPSIYGGERLNKVIDIISHTESYYYPVVDQNKHLLGAITFDGIRQAFRERQLSDWLVAMDLIEPVTESLTPDQPLDTAIEKTRRLDVNFLPVIDTENRNSLLGVLDARYARRKLSTELLKRQS